jgi:hypothetical protein
MPWFAEALTPHLTTDTRNQMAASAARLAFGHSHFGGVFRETDSATDATSVRTARSSSTRRAWTEKQENPPGGR